MSDKSLGESLKFHRELNGFTLRQVEEAIGVSNAYLSQLENEKIKSPSAHVLYKLANLYCIELDSLLFAAGYIKALKKSSASVLTLGVITVDEQAELLEYLKYLRFKKNKYPIPN